MQYLCRCLDLVEIATLLHVLDLPDLDGSISSATDNLRGLSPGDTAHTILVSVHSLDTLTRVGETPDEDICIETTTGSLLTIWRPGDASDTGSVGRPAVSGQRPF